MATYDAQSPSSTCQEAPHKIPTCRTAQESISWPELKNNAIPRGICCLGFSSWVFQHQLGTSTCSEGSGALPLGVSAQAAGLPAACSASAQTKLLVTLKSSLGLKDLALKNDLSAAVVFGEQICHTLDCLTAAEAEGSAISHLHSTWPCLASPLFAAACLQMELFGCFQLHAGTSSAPILGFKQHSSYPRGPGRNQLQFDCHPG